MGMWLTVKTANERKSITWQSRDTVLHWNRPNQIS